MTYQEFIDNIINTRGRFNCSDQYHERHHIIPKCMGGKDDKDNLIDLYAKEHFIAHKLLANENPNNTSLVQAYAIMAFVKNKDEKRYELTPEEYEEARTTFSEALKDKYKNKENHPCYGKHISEERKQLISRINKGNKYCLGRKLSDETKRKIGEANRNPSEETRKKMSEASKKHTRRGQNPRAKKVMRLSDNKIYDCIIDAAEDNKMHRGTIAKKANKGDGFIFYNEK